jgi:hypothetical protein
LLRSYLARRVNGWGTADTSLNDFEKWLLKRCFESARALDVKLSPEELSAMPLELSWVHDEIAECAAQIGGL